MGTERTFENTIAARAALLDFYGDQATSFASQFVASIFGLVTISAVILTMSQSLSQSISQNTNWLVIILFLILSLPLYLAFSYIAQYTYGRFTNYASLASHLVTVPGGLLERAHLEELETYYEKEHYEKTKELLKQASEECKPHLPKGTILIREDRKGEEVKGAHINLRLHLDVVYKRQQKALIKRITPHTRTIHMVMLLFLAILSLICYFPLIVSIITNFI
jgi:hypothetical protein